MSDDDRVDALFPNHPLSIQATLAIDPAILRDTEKRGGSVCESNLHTNVNSTTYKATDGTQGYEKQR
jgi:hypothetical protein